MTTTTLTLGQASRLTGRGKTTLARMIRRGALSATRTEEGEYRIDAAELHRAVPFPAPGEPASATAATGPAVHHATASGATGDLVATLREMLADMRQERDHWRDQAQRLATDRRERRPWWRRIAG